MPARIVVAAQKIVATGLAPQLTQPTVDGDVIPVGNVALMVTNTGAAMNVTVQTPVKVDGLDVAEQIVPVATGVTKLIGPLPASTYGRSVAPDVGSAYVDYSAIAGVTRALVSL